MRPEKIKAIFEACKIPDWEFEGGWSPASAQAVVAQVKNSISGQHGVFRCLKGKERGDIEKFRREVKILTKAEFRNKNILNILAFGMHAPYWYISERGSDFPDHWEKLRAEYADRPDVLVEKALNIIVKIAEGLIPLHKQGVVHRDIKPQNIILVNNEPVLIDFGLAYCGDKKPSSLKAQSSRSKKYSRAQLLFHSKSVFPWGDVYLLSRLLVWLVAERAAKDSFKPFDQKAPQYPQAMSERNVNGLGELLTICSEPYTGIKNAEEMIGVIKRIFSF